jgi:hypothetical protein
MEVMEALSLLSSLQSKALVISAEYPGKVNRYISLPIYFSTGSSEGK